MKLSRWLSTCLVDSAFYLSRYNDVALAKVDPIEHFAQHAFSEPLRSASLRYEKVLKLLLPFIIIVLFLRNRFRPDLFSLLRAHIDQLQSENRRFRALFPTAVHALYGRLQPIGSGKKLLISYVYKNSAKASQYTLVERAGVFEGADPDVLMAHDKKIAKRKLRLPSLWCATLNDVQLFGTLQIARQDKFFVNEPAADPRFSFVAGQHQYVTAQLPNPLDSKRYVLAQVPSSATSSALQGVLLGGRCGNNYFHFLIEYVTKGYIIEKIAELQTVPLIVPDDLYSQEKEILNIVFPDRDLILHRSGTRLDVATLYVPSVMTFIPDCPRFPFWQVSAMNHNSLSWLRQKVLSVVNVRAKRLTNRRVYLARFGGRNIINSDAVSAIFRRNDFEVVDTSRMTFEEQVILFATSSHIAGPVGAAFSNLIFSSNHSKVLGIVSPFAVQMSLFKSLSDFAGGQYYALPGEHPEFVSGMETRRPSLNITHGSFSVNEEYLTKALKYFCSL